MTKKNPLQATSTKDSQAESFSEGLKMHLEILRDIEKRVSPSEEKVNELDQLTSSYIERMSGIQSFEDFEAWDESPEYVKCNQIAEEININAKMQVADYQNRYLRARQLRDLVLEKLSQGAEISDFDELLPSDGLELVVLIAGVNKRIQTKAEQIAQHMLSERGRQGAIKRHAESNALKDEFIKFWRKSGLSKNGAAYVFAKENSDGTPRTPLLNEQTLRGWLKGVE